MKISKYNTMDNIVDRDIGITGLEIKETTVGPKYIVSDNKTKYEFWTKKKDGTSTKAFEQWQAFGLGVGKRVQAGVKEEPAEYSGHTFTRRTIMFFRGDEHDVPYQQDVPVNVEVDIEGLVSTAIEAHERDYHNKGGVDTKDDALPF